MKILAFVNCGDLVRNLQGKAEMGGRGRERGQHVEPFAPVPRASLANVARLRGVLSKTFVGLFKGRMGLHASLFRDLGSSLGIRV